MIETEIPGKENPGEGAGTPINNNAPDVKKAPIDKEHSDFIRKSWLLAPKLISYILDKPHLTPAIRNQFYWKLWQQHNDVKRYVFDQLSCKIDRSDLILLQIEFKQYGDRQQGFLLAHRARRRPIPKGYVDVVTETDNPDVEINKFDRRDDL